MPKVILLLLIIFLLVAPSVAFATTMKYQVDIGAPTNIGPNSIGTYIAAIYKTALGVVGVLAVVVMMFGGIMWMMAGGNPERIQSAKGWVFGAMSGLVLAFSSYTILNIINPKLVKFKAITQITEPPGWMQADPKGGSNVTCIEEGQACLDGTAINCCGGLSCNSHNKCVKADEVGGTGCCLAKYQTSLDWYYCRDEVGETDCDATKLFGLAPGMNPTQDFNANKACKKGQYNVYTCE